MTRSASIGAIAIAAGLVACGGSSSTVNTELQRDLQLASASTMNLAAPRVDPSLLNSLETKPTGAPQTAKTVKKGPGPRALRSEAPTVRATPEMDVAAVDETQDEVQTESVAPVPEPSNEPVAVAPRPEPVVVQSGGSGDYGTSGNGGGIFGTGGGIGGVVIRGGGVDGDNCDLHRGRGRTGGVWGSPSGGRINPPSVPRTGGIFIGGNSPRRGGMGGSRLERAPSPASVASGVRGVIAMRRGGGIR